MSNIKPSRIYVQEEIVAALEAVTEIRELVEENGSLNKDEVTVVNHTLESFVNKFKIKTIATSLESSMSPASSKRYADSIITALESRLERYQMM